MGWLVQLTVLTNSNRQTYVLLASSTSRNRLIGTYCCNVHYNGASAGLLSCKRTFNSKQDTVLLLQGIFAFGVACCVIVKQELRLLQSRGYIKVHRATAWFTVAIPFILALGNCVILILWSVQPSPLSM